MMTLICRFSAILYEVPAALKVQTINSVFKPEASKYSIELLQYGCGIPKWTTTNGEKVKRKKRKKKVQKHIKLRHKVIPDHSCLYFKFDKVKFSKGFIMVTMEKKSCARKDEAKPRKGKIYLTMMQRQSIASFAHRWVSHLQYHDE